MSLLRIHIDALLDRLDTYRAVIDAPIPRPARWQGPIRSAIGGQEGRRKRGQVRRAFNSLVASQRRGGLGDLSADALRELHSMVGGSGSFRSHGARIGRFVIHHRAADLPDLVEQALERANDGFEPPALAAARVHMELLLIHPFRDGNGRTARLASSWVLLRAGFRSTLLTAVEQHARTVPGSYFRSFRLLETSQPTQHSEWLRTALTDQIESSRYAYEYRSREIEMRGVLLAAGVEPRRHARILADHESGIATAAAALLSEFPRWSRIVETMPADTLHRAGMQIERLHREERTPARTR